jgi:hypothetical protein
VPRRAAREALTSSRSAALARALAVLPRRTSLALRGEAIELDLRVLALKPLDLRADLVVTRAAGGGSWRFPLHLAVAAAPPDAVIRVSSPLNVPGAVTFAQRNAVPRASPFRAYFTLDSPAEFNVSPAAGVLPSTTAALYAAGTGFADSSAVDTPLTVTFVPREYGVSYRGLLVVETDEMTWSYEVLGSLPRYAPPTGAGARGVEDHLDARALAALRASREVASRRDVVAGYAHVDLRPGERAAGVMIRGGGATAAAAAAAAASPAPAVDSTAARISATAMSAGAGRPLLHPAAEGALRAGMASGEGVAARPSAPNSFGVPHGATYLGSAGSLLQNNSAPLSISAAGPRAHAGTGGGPSGRQAR